MQRYVTYLADGTLDGCYLQVPPAEHAGRMIVIDEEQAEIWVTLRANDTRDGVEPALLQPQNINRIPASVTMRQARLALLSIGVLDDVDQAINSLPSPEKEKARIEWDYSSTVDRNRPFVATLGHALKLDDAALDQLFIEAAKL